MSDKKTITKSTRKKKRRRSPEAKLVLRRTAGPIGKRPKRGKLNAKQIAFVEAFARCGNATQSALAAGYSPRTAGFHGAYLLKQPHIRAGVARRRDLMQKDTELNGKVTRDYILDILTQIAECDPGDIASWAGKTVSLRESTGLDPRVRKCIQGISSGPNGPSFKTADRLRAVELLAKMQGYLKDRHEISGPDGTAIQFYLPDNTKRPPVVATPVPPPDEDETPTE